MFFACVIAVEHALEAAEMRLDVLRIWEQSRYNEKILVVAINVVPYLAHQSVPERTPRAIHAS